MLSCVAAENANYSGESFDTKQACGQAKHSSVPASIILVVSAAFAVFGHGHIGSIAVLSCSCTKIERRLQNMLQQKVARMLWQR